MINVFIILILVIFALSGARMFLRRAAGISCCGEGDRLMRTGPKDKHKSHYPLSAVMDITGMKCKECAVRVENALNAVDGVYARVHLHENTAVLLLKRNLSDEDLSLPVEHEGYHVEGISRKKR